MTRPERILRLLLRLYAITTLCAIFAVFMPRSWMVEIHEMEALGLGPFPDYPIVYYLARSLSAFYTMFGVLLWIISCDVRRYAPLITFTAWAGIFFGILFLVVDWRIDLPLSWTLGEGPSVIVCSVVLLVLRTRVQPYQPN